jgi:hypothetical protein
MHHNMMQVALIHDPFFKRLKLNNITFCKSNIKKHGPPVIVFHKTSYNKQCINLAILEFVINGW